MGAKTIKRTLREQRRAHAQTFDRVRRGRVAFVAITQDPAGKILSVGINYEAAVKQLEKLGIQDQPYNIADFQVSC